jgi:hypothetical protein
MGGEGVVVGRVGGLPAPGGLEAGEGGAAGADPAFQAGVTYRPAPGGVTGVVTPVTG